MYFSFCLFFMDSVRRYDSRAQNMKAPSLLCSFCFSSGCETKVADSQKRNPEGENTYMLK